MDIPYERKQWARLLIHEVPRPVLTPILEAIGDEDESMVDRYAALLANAAAGAEDEIPPSFPNILPDGRWIRSSPA